MHICLFFCSSFAYNQIIDVSLNTSSLSASDILKDGIADVWKSTICNLLKKDIPQSDKDKVTKVRIDDFAFKKRHTYGRRIKEGHYFAGSLHHNSYLSIRFLQQIVKVFQILLYMLHFKRSAHDFTVRFKQTDRTFSFDTSIPTCLIECLLITLITTLLWY